MSGLIAKKVLVPFDYSERCVNAVRRALKIAADDGQVTVLHAMVDFYPVHPAELFPDYSEDAQRRVAELKMQDMLASAGINLDKVRLVFAIGDAGIEVTEHAKEEGTDLIVVPSHGRRGVQRWLLGSVAERIARLAPCPVLIVKESEGQAS